MKKLILSALLLSAITFVACNKDDDGGNCVSCEIEGVSNDVCAGDNGKVAGTDLTPQEFLNEFCDNGTPTENPNANCITCAAYTFQGMSMPAQEVCKGDNGNAFVKGTDMQVEYDLYLEILQTQTTCQ